MFEFDELEAALPPEAYIVYGAGCTEVNGLYQDTHLEVHGAQIFRHSVMSDQLLARERCGETLGWLIGANRRPLYGVRTEKVECPKTGWRAFKGEKPAPIVEGFSSIADASQRLAQVWCEEAEGLVAEQRFRHAGEVYKRALGIPVLAENRRAEIHAFRARTFRQLAESKKKVRQQGGGADEERDKEDDPLHGLAAEWAIEEAEEALKHNPKCFLAGWEGAIAAKHIGWWNKGRILAKKAMQAVPSGPAHRSQRETASTLFLLMAEEEQEEKARKVREMQKARETPEVPLDPKELAWALGVAQQLNEALKSEDFKRPHHQLWKLIGPGLTKKDSDEIFGEIRQLVWEKWNAVAWQHGYRTSWDVMARRKMCARIVDIANSGRAQEVKTLIKEIEDRSCIEWPEIAESVEKIRYDETWAWTKRDDGSWGAWDGPTSL
mmetsp:Transcript_43587/g.98341  ORF Transcript_43587/g.98341 Transcript_43587/m.98341 type:complete len:436 (+) Transcript_43587:77-1384(+)